MLNEPSSVFLCGRLYDRVVEDGGALRFAERIVVLDRGRIVEQGTHRELMALGGLYYRTALLQGIGASEAGAGEALALADEIAAGGRGEPAA
jgi:hypothetical protein